MLKRLLTLVVAAAALTVTGCGCNGGFLHCERPCYGKAFRRDARQMTDFVDTYFLTYDKHDPFRCDPCLGD